MATPTPLNNILWYVVANNGKEFYISYYSLLDKENKLIFETVQRNDSLLSFSVNQDQLNDIKHFSRDYYCVTQKNDTVIFSDMRFGQLNGWLKPSTPFVFNFETVKLPGETSEIKQSEFARFDGAAFGQLLTRIKGK